MNEVSAIELSRLASELGERDGPADGLAIDAECVSGLDSWLSTVKPDVLKLVQGEDRKVSTTVIDEKLDVNP